MAGQFSFLLTMKLIDMFNNTIQLRLQTLSPVHIGSGQDLKAGFDYLYFERENLLGVISPEKILDLIGEDHLGQWVSSIEQGLNIRNSLPQLKNIDPKSISTREIIIGGAIPNDNKNTIKEQVHLGRQQPTIPGSSLKGAIRTVLLTKLIKDNPQFVQNNNHLGFVKEGNIVRYHSGNIEAYYTTIGEPKANRFGEYRLDPNENAFRFLRVRDAYFDVPTSVFKNTVINLFYNDKWGEKRGESSFYECIPAGASTDFSIQVPEELLKEVQKKKKVSHPIFDLIRFPRLFREINKHTLALLENEIAFWKEEDNPIVIGDYLDHLQQIFEITSTLDDNACVLRVGVASGWEFMTGGWPIGKDRMGDYILSDATWKDLKRRLRRRNYPDDIPFPKTRKLMEGGVPFGFVKISK